MVISLCNMNHYFLVYGFATCMPSYSPQTANPFTITPIKQLATVYQKLATSLAWQSLPKCHPEIFGRDVTLFHPLKNAFWAMIKEADMSPVQEIDYLRFYTKGEVQKVVNNYWQRQYMDPTVALLYDWLNWRDGLGTQLLPWTSFWSSSGKQPNLEEAGTNCKLSWTSVQM